MVYPLSWLRVLAGTPWLSPWQGRQGGLLRVDGRVEIGALRDVVHQDCDVTGQGDECDTSWRPPVDEPLVDRLKEMVAVAGAYSSGHVQRASQLPAASARPRLLPDRAARVLDGRDAGHLGDALGRERPDVRTGREHRADQHGANADNLLKSHGKGVHLLVRPYRFGAKRVHLFNLSLKGVNDS